MFCRIPVGRRALGWISCGLLILISAGSVSAQVLIAADDLFGVPFGITMVVEAFGVLENDILDGESAGENGATAELVTGVSHGTLSLSTDGSFTFSPDSTFDGSDSFVYRAVFSTVADTATVVLSACSGGPDVFTCWKETAFRAKAAELGFATFNEGFEDDAVWGIARSPVTVPSVVSRGVRWMSNHPDPPAENNITTGPGPAWTGQWGFFDQEHGYATGTPAQCDIDNPPEHCLYHDGWTGVLEPGQTPLHGVGGYITGIYGANVEIFLDSLPAGGGGKITFGHQFFGAIDARPAGFTRFEFRELDGKIGNALYIWSDDFTLVTEAQTSVGEALPRTTSIFFAGAGPNPSKESTTLRFSIPARDEVSLKIYDTRGREVRVLTDRSLDAGAHSVVWDGRNHVGRRVSTGVYFGRLVVGAGDEAEVLVKKVTITR